jgi:hypothetical protein
VTSKARSARYSPDGRWLATADLDGGVRLWGRRHVDAGRGAWPPVPVPAGDRDRRRSRLAGRRSAGGRRSRRPTPGPRADHRPLARRALRRAGGPRFGRGRRRRRGAALRRPRARGVELAHRRPPRALVGHRKDVEEIAVEPDRDLGRHPPASTAPLGGGGSPTGAPTRSGAAAARWSTSASPATPAITGGADGQLRRWRGDDEQLIGAHAAGLVSLEVAPDGATVAAGDQDGHLGLWSTAPSLVLEPIAPAVSQVLTVDRARIEIGPRRGAAGRRHLAGPTQPPGGPRLDRRRSPADRRRPGAAPWSSPDGDGGAAARTRRGDGLALRHRRVRPGRATGRRPTCWSRRSPGSSSAADRARPPRCWPRADGALRAPGGQPRRTVGAGRERRPPARGGRARPRGPGSRPRWRVQPPSRAWLDEQHAVLGTASGDLVRLDVATGGDRGGPRPATATRPRRSRRSTRRARRPRVRRRRGST